MLNRREWLLTTGAVLASTAAAAPQRTRIGIELGSIGASKWTPYQYLDYFQTVGIEAAQFNAGTLGIRPGAPLDENELKKIREYAAGKGVALVSFSGSSICPTSSSFNAKAGTAEEHIAQGLKIARIIGASAMRVVLGSYRERPEIDRHLAGMKQVLKNTRSQIRDSGIKLALENHNADLQAREIKALIEEAGSDILGVCLDSGNPLVTMEDPHLTLELLGPYTLTSHVRDTALWRVPEGVAVRWVNMGEGNVDIDGWVKKFVAMHPGLPIIFENLPMVKPRMVPVFTADALRYYPNMPAADLSRFLALAERGKPLADAPPPSPATRGDQQRADLELCIRYTRKILDAAPTAANRG